MQYQLILFSLQDAEVHLLHSQVPSNEQRHVFDPPKDPNHRKVVIATNIAETSITIEDVVYVIDCGRAKLQMFDPKHNVTSLDEEWIAKANAKQRKGRAGRVREGTCYRLYLRVRIS